MLSISSMAGPSSTVPYYGQYDNSELLNMFNVSNPILADLSSINDPILYPLPNPQINNNNVGILNASDPFDDPILWNMYNNGSSQVGPSEVRGDTCNVGGENLGRENVGDGNNGMPLPVWPVEPVPFWCSCCQVLREIIHTNGQIITKLEIHGRLGMICHAILEIRQDAIATSSSGLVYHMFDFCKKSIEDVKQFLIQYNNERKQAGFMMVQDPLSIFYEALCVGLEWDETLGANDFSQLSPLSPVNLDVTNQVNHPETEIDPAPKTSKTPLAAQRERAGKMTVQDLGNYFHLPIETAAKQIELCPTVLKKICRRDGLNRWPHRKIKSLMKRISDEREKLHSDDAEERARAQAKLPALEKELSDIFSGLSR